MTNKKLQENSDAMAEMNKHLRKLQSVIENMEKKRGEIFIEWLQQQNKYLVWEENFDPSYLRAYRRGEIILAQFGFNVGAEYGGMHYAVVVRGSSKNNPNINVVPLSSLEEEASEKDIHKDRVLLGQIKG